MYRLDLLSVGLVEENASVVVVLRSDELERLLVMEVGLLEGRAIALEAEGGHTVRPLTHELTIKALEGLGATLEQVEIREFRDKLFYATVVIQQGDKRVELDARPSDAVSLALRAKAPILATEQVMEVAGVTPEEADLDDVTTTVDADDDTSDDDEDEGPTILH